MKIKKLKTLLIKICSVVIALWSETQGIENSPDILDLDTLKRITRTESFSQNEVDDEDPQVSWASYLLSPAKSVIQTTYEIMDSINQCPRWTLFVSIYIGCQLMSAVSATELITDKRTDNYACKELKASDGKYYLPAGCYHTPQPWEQKYTLPLHDPILRAFVDKIQEDALEKLFGAFLEALGEFFKPKDPFGSFKNNP